MLCKLLLRVRENNDIVRITGVQNPGIVHVPVHVAQIEICQKRRQRNARHNALPVLAQIPLVDDIRIFENRLDQAAQKRFRDKHFPHHGNHLRNVHRVEVIVDIQFVGEAVRNVSASREICHRLLDAAVYTEGKKVRGEEVVIAVEMIRDHLQKKVAIVGKCVHNALLLASHLVDNPTLRTGKRSLGKPLRQGLLVGLRVDLPAQLRKLALCDVLSAGTVRVVRFPNLGRFQCLQKLHPNLLKCPGKAKCEKPA